MAAVSDSGDLVPNRRPSLAHERRRRELHALGNLLGFHADTVFPDGSIPDVLLANTESGSLFVGDAKQTEAPTGRATAARLLGYLSWLRASPKRASHVFAIAHPPGRDLDWAHLLTSLATEAGVDNEAPIVRRQSATTVVTLMRVHGGTDA